MAVRLDIEAEKVGHVAGVDVGVAEAGTGVSGGGTISAVAEDEGAVTDRLIGHREGAEAAASREAVPKIA